YWLNPMLIPEAVRVWEGGNTLPTSLSVIGRSTRACFLYPFFWSLSCASFGDSGFANTYRVSALPGTPGWLMTFLTKRTIAWHSALGLMKSAIGHAPPTPRFMYVGWLNFSSSFFGFSS